jgi:hypothetical protein
MSAANQLHVVEGGNHSLELPNAMLKAGALTQESVDAGIVACIAGFLASVARNP